MALYEVVLRFPDHDETRLDDRGGYAPAAKVVIDDRPYVVIGTEPPRRPDVQKRFVLVPADE